MTALSEFRCHTLGIWLGLSRALLDQASPACLEKGGQFEEDIYDRLLIFIDYRVNPDTT